MNKSTYKFKKLYKREGEQCDIAVSLSSNIIVSQFFFITVNTSSYSELDAF